MRERLSAQGCVYQPPRVGHHEVRVNVALLGDEKRTCAGPDAREWISIVLPPSADRGKISGGAGLCILSGLRFGLTFPTCTHLDVRVQCGLDQTGHGGKVWNRLCCEPLFTSAQQA